MDKNRRARYQRRLEKEYRDLQDLLSSTAIAGRNADEQVPEDAAEKAANSYAKEFLFRQSDSERSHLHLVEEALVRLRSDEFGLCQSCGEPIDRKRLDAIPWARFCRSCQEQEEKHGNSNNASL
jgi:RNA polymerase-binding transcription factor